ncbi:MAG: hypothetical protein AVDCRST_MAG08-3496, partial [uncultured Acetobacteraceae bacterium]
GRTPPGSVPRDPPSRRHGPPRPLLRGRRRRAGEESPGEFRHRRKGGGARPRATGCRVRPPLDRRLHLLAGGAGFRRDPRRPAPGKRGPDRRRAGRMRTHYRGRRAEGPRLRPAGRLDPRPRRRPRPADGGGRARLPRADPRQLLLRQLDQGRRRRTQLGRRHHRPRPVRRLEPRHRQLQPERRAAAVAALPRHDEGRRRHAAVPGPAGRSALPAAEPSEGNLHPAGVEAQGGTETPRGGTGGRETPAEIPPRFRIMRCGEITRLSRLRFMVPGL